MARGGRPKRRKAPAASAPVGQVLDAILTMRKEDAEVSMSVEDAIAEIRASLTELEPEAEGLRDYASLDLLPDTREEIEAAIVVYDRRILLLTVALDALLELEGDGHPELPVRQIPEPSYEDLVANFETIKAALAKFEAAPQATSLGLSSSPAEPKE